MIPREGKILKPEMVKCTNLAAMICIAVFCFDTSYVQNEVASNLNVRPLEALGSINENDESLNIVHMDQIEDGNDQSSENLATGILELTDARYKVEAIWLINGKIVN